MSEADKKLAAETAQKILSMNAAGNLMTVHNKPAIIAIIAEALSTQREADAKKAEAAKLPKGFQWGHDAMEQFNFGKERAAEAIRQGK